MSFNHAVISFCSFALLITRTSYSEFGSFRKVIFWESVPRLGKVCMLPSLSTGSPWHFLLCFHVSVAVLRHSWFGLIICLHLLFNVCRKHLTLLMLLVAKAKVIDEAFGALLSLPSTKLWHLHLAWVSRCEWKDLQTKPQHRYVTPTAETT